MRIRETQVQLTRRVNAPEQKRVSGLPDPLSCHHRPNEKCIQVPVGDISEVEGGADHVPAFNT